MTIDTTNLGFKWRGPFNPFATYARGDVFRKDGKAMYFDGQNIVDMAIGQSHISTYGGLATYGGAVAGGVEGQELKTLSNGSLEWQFDAGRRSNAAIRLMETCGQNGSTDGSHGGYTNAAIMTDGSIMAWGYNSQYQLGEGGTAQRTYPMRIPFPPGTPRMVRLFQKQRAFYAIDEFGGLWGWGYAGGNYVFGDGSTANHTNPTRLNGFGDLPDDAVVTFVTGSEGGYSSKSYAAMILTLDGSVYFSGANVANVSGIDTATATYQTWKRVPVDEPIVRIQMLIDSSYPISVLHTAQGHIYLAGSPVMTGDVNNVAGSHPRHVKWPRSIEKPVRDVSFNNSRYYVNTTYQYDNYPAVGITHWDGTIATLGGGTGFSIADTTSPGYSLYNFTQDTRIDNVKQLLVHGGGYEVAVALKNDGTIWATGAVSAFSNPTTTYTNSSTTWVQLLEFGSNNEEIRMICSMRAVHLSSMQSGGTVQMASNSYIPHLGDGTSVSGGIHPQVALRHPIVEYNIHGYTVGYPASHALVSTFRTADGSIYTTGHGGFHSLGNEDDQEDRYTPSIVLT